MSQSMSQWSNEKSADVYGINDWGNGYFRINNQGNVSITPTEKGANGPQLDLYELTQDLVERGIRVPVMIRFPDIIKARVDLINNCFKKAIADHGYKGQYSGVYPIKVNQQRHLVQELVKFGYENRMGLECGSKPELLVVLALMNNPDALIICNGFKDQEYVETAILSQKLGRNTIIVVDRMDELQLIIDASKKFSTKAKIGFRAKLNTQGAGKWVDSSGARSKFGLTAIEIMDGINLLKKENMLDCLELIHFHIGSQIPAINCIKSSLKEGVRFLSEFSALGARIKYMDVGGGLGVDYDGTGSSDSSINYSEQEYANDIVSAIQSMCDSQNIPHPDIITESGRFLVAHHSVLVFNVTGVNDLTRQEPPMPAKKTDHQLLQDLQYIYEKVNKENINECFNDLSQAKEELLSLFTYGVVNLEQRAWAETMSWAISTKMIKIAQTMDEEADDIKQALQQELCDTYFCNFSLFQSLPDSWAVGQLFPVMPIHRLSDEPNRQATLADLTCDSDGKIEKFIDTETKGYKKTLQMHEYKVGQAYYVGVFLTGAYQEILGDLHNLFGDTDAVHVSVSEAGYTIDHYVPGDTVTEVLSYVQYRRSNMVESVRNATEQGILKGNITKQEAKLLIKHYEEGLSGYTYLEEPEVN